MNFQLCLPKKKEIRKRGNVFGDQQQSQTDDPIKNVNEELKSIFLQSNNTQQWEIDFKRPQSPKNTQPRYQKSLKRQHKIRERERSILRERAEEKQRIQEASVLGDSLSFITPSYAKLLEKNKKYESKLQNDSDNNQPRQAKQQITKPQIILPEIKQNAEPQLPDKKKDDEVRLFRERYLQRRQNKL